MFGLPIALRAGPIRFDTGLYVPIIFYDPTQTIVSIPLHIWIQADARLLAGADARAARREPGRQRHRVPARVRAGLAASRAVDLRTWFLFPDMNQQRRRAQLRASASRSKSGSSSGFEYRSGEDHSTRARRASSVALGTAPRI